MQILVTGASGKLGLYLLREAQRRQIPLLASSRRPPRPDFGHRFLEGDIRTLDWPDPQPQVVIHCAAMAAVGDWYADPEAAFSINSQASARLGQICRERGIRLVYVSTDMVFSGEAAPYAEDFPPDAASVYGRSKAEAERQVLEQGHSVLRPALMIGSALGAAQSYYDHILQQFGLGNTVDLFQDEWRSMISYAEVARGLLDLAAADQVSGIYHLGGPRRSRFELGLALAERMGCPQLVRPSLRSQVASPEPRPRDLSMTCERWQLKFPQWKPRHWLDTE
jgi:dTDP-4-dehydrorhamnose reductase